MAEQPGDRRSPEFSVRVFGIDAGNKPFSRTATAFNIRNTAVCFRGIGVELRLGDIVGVQSGGAKARFRVTANQDAGGNSCGYVEAIRIDGGQSIWAVPAVPTPGVPATDSSVPSRPADKPQPGNRERRRFERYKCDLGAVVVGEGGKRLWARCSDVSLGGCYLETWSPFPLGAEFHLELDGIAITAAVSACHPNVGMGVRFVNVSAQQRLQTLVETLRSSAAGA